MLKSRAFWITLILLVLLPAAWLKFAWHWSYSSGERAGWVQKFSHKGWVCKTWEGELSLVSMPGAAPEKFNFTVHDEETAAAITRAMGQRVSLHYEQKIGLPTSCFGETRHFVTGIHVAEQVPLGPQVTVPQPPPLAASAAPVASAPASL